MIKSSKKKLGRGHIWDDIIPVIHMQKLIKVYSDPSMLLCLTLLLKVTWKKVVLVYERGPLKLI